MKSYQTLIGFCILAVAILGSSMLLADEMKLIANALNTVASKLSIIASQINYTANGY